MLSITAWTNSEVAISPIVVFTVDKILIFFEWFWSWCMGSTVEKIFWLNWLNKNTIVFRELLIFFPFLSFISLFRSFLMIKKHKWIQIMRSLLLWFSWYSIVLGINYSQLFFFSPFYHFALFLSTLEVSIMTEPLDFPRSQHEFFIWLAVTGLSYSNPVVIRSKTESSVSLSSETDVREFICVCSGAKSLLISIVWLCLAVSPLRLGFLNRVFPHWKKRIEYKTWAERLTKNGKIKIVSSVSYVESVLWIKRKHSRKNSGNDLK